MHLSACNANVNNDMHRERKSNHNEGCAISVTTNYEYLNETLGGK